MPTKTANALSDGKPNPGSNTARDLGCICPVLDNWHGLGYMGIAGVFVYSYDCPLHGGRIPPPPQVVEVLE
jgi:hypothetical protein